MPSIFISYRREDTSGEAGHLAGDLRSRFGRSNVFIDIDAISPGADFEQRIADALDGCQVTLVLIGSRWLRVANPDGKRRLDDERDYVRREIAAALAREDVTVVPVLVEGAQMPDPLQLPADLSPLAKRNAFELSNKRWRFDVGQLSAVALRHDSWWARRIRAIRVRRIALAGALAAASIATLLVVTSPGSGTNGSRNRTVLVPATVASKIDECTRQLWTAVDGTVGPLNCSGKTLNTLAWQYYAKFDPLVMALGPYATEGQVINTICADLRGGARVTIPQETESYQLAAQYYGWRFVLPPDPSTMRC